MNIFAPTFDQPASTTAPEGISTSLAGQVSTLPGEVQDVILHYLPPSVLIKLGLSRCRLRHILLYGSPPQTNVLLASIWRSRLLGEIPWHYSYAVYSDSEVNSLAGLAKWVGLMPGCPYRYDTTVERLECKNFCVWFSPTGDCELEPIHSVMNQILIRRQYVVHDSYPSSSDNDEPMDTDSSDSWELGDRF